MSVRCWVGLTSLLLFSVAYADDSFRLDGRNTEVTFVGTKKDGKHDGGFKEVKGTITVKENDPTTAQVKVDIDLNSMFTDNSQLTNHLKSADFFNVKKYPTAKFVSTKVEKKGSKFDIHGKLTMNNVTKEVVIPATIEVSGPGVSLESTWEINRHDWKISYGPNQVDAKVKITIKATAPKN